MSDVDPGSSDSLHNQQDNGIVFDLSELNRVEKDVERENEENAAIILNESDARVHPTGPKESYRRLQVLLNKSNIYAELILSRMKQDREKAATRLKKAQEKEAAKQKTEEAKQSESVSARRTCKRKTAEESMADFFDEKDLKIKHRQYLEEKHQVAPEPVVLCSDKVAFECDLRYFTGGTLRDYQIEGLCWLKTQYEQGINGILADEMGLGKTIQCIALFAHFYAKGVPGPFLVVAPLSTLPNWYSEVKKFAPKLPVVLYHGVKDNRVELRRQIQNGSVLGSNNVRPIILTSYEVFMNDRALITRFNVRYLVIDEGHRVKNFKCKLLRQLRHVNCSRLLMTGTPLQNNLAELWSLLNFLLPEVFTDLDWFENFFAFDSIFEDAQEAEEQERLTLAKLHSILSPFLLRRIKTDVEMGLPAKQEIWVYAPLTSDQMAMYKAACDQYILQYCGIDKKEKLEAKRRSVWRPVIDENKECDEREQKLSTYQYSLRTIRSREMLLRKVCLHPYLFEYPLDENDQYKIDEQLVLKSGKLIVFDQLLGALIERRHKVLVFSQFTSMLDILYDYCCYRKFGFARLDGRMDIDERKEEMEKFANDPHTQVFLISTRAGGLGLNLTAADTVIIFDSDYNPQGDLQAQDRCHRIGQTKPVLVYRLICRGSIEEKVIKFAMRKRRLEKMVIQQGKFCFPVQDSQEAVMSNEEFDKLIHSNDYNQIWEIDDRKTQTGKKNLISKQNLEKLLDRNSLVEEKCDDIEEDVMKNDAAYVLKPVYRE